MKFLLLAVLSSMLSVAATAQQIKDPVKWTTVSKKTATGYAVIITASLASPWHIYSQHTGDGGPVPTTFKFTKNPLLTFDGEVKEVGKLVEQYDKNFDTKLKYFGDKVAFVQMLKVKGNVKTNLNVTVEYMTCDDSKCLPPVKKTFNVSL